MMSRISALVLVLLLIVLGLSLQAWYWPQLPARMATHFGKNGDPNDWMSKPVATVLNCALVIVIPVFFLLIGRMIRSLPTAMINLPNREYWFAPERRQQSIDWVTARMSWFSVAIAAFVVVVNHLTFMANRDAEALQTKPFLFALATFLIVALGIVVSMIHKFMRTTPNNNDSPPRRTGS